MSFSFQDSTARTAWGNATSQTGQLTAFRALWSGDVTVRYYTIGGTHLGTATHSGWDAIDTGTTPYSVTLAGRPAWSHLADGTAAYCIVAVPGGADIIRSDVSLAAAVSASTGVANLDNAAGAAGLRIDATASLSAASTPAWLSGMAVNEWKELTGTKLSDQPGIDTGASSGKQDAWCGWVIDPRTSKVYSPGQGGHDDYHGNEVDVIDLSADAPAWSQLLSSSPSSAVNSGEADEYYDDGRPASVHGYFTGILSQTLEKILRFPGGSKATHGAPMTTITAFNLANNTWDVAATWAGSAIPVSAVDGNQFCGAKHPTTEKVYFWHYNSRIYEWSPASPTSWTTLLTGPPAAPSGTAAAIDPTRGTSGAGVMFALGGGSGGAICHKYDLGATSSNPVAITLTGTDISATARAGFGLFYCDATDKFYARPSGSAGSLVYEITPTSGTSWACSLLSTTGGSSLTETIGNGAGGASPYTKFLYVPAYGCAVLSPRWGDNVWILKLHEV